MKLYNTLTHQLDEIIPLDTKSNKLGFYACGPTVYDYAHLGHLRKFTFDDVLLRTLKHAGFEVNFVQNITDVGHLASDGDSGEDKLEKGARKYGKTAWDVALEFEDYFWKSMDLMGNIRPNISCRATDHIAEQLQMVVELEKKGFTYIIKDDGVYFDTSKLDDYGKLARLQLDDLKAGATVEMIEGKKNPTDFALWKFERPGENRAMVWESPWAKRSFPGWHIECSAMSSHYLGDQFEIHTGGIDHIPVHHTNEIAQAEASTGKKPFVKYWVHHNFLQIEGQKMSKSLDNFYTVDTLLERGFEPVVFRLLLLGGHYRSEMNFTWDSLTAASKAWEKLKTLVIDLNGNHRSDTGADLSAEAQEYHRRFFVAMEDDLKTPEATAVLWELTKDSKISKANMYRLLLEFDEVLGLGLAKLEARDVEYEIQGIPVAVQKLLDERQVARQEKDWAKSDQLRQELRDQGWAVWDDRAGKQTVNKI